MKAARVLAWLLTATPAGAHDFWIQPASFHPEAGALVEVELRVGDHGRGDPVARDEARILRFDVTGPLAADAAPRPAPRPPRPIVGRDGGLPAGLVRLQEPGTHVLVYRSTQASLELEAEKFERYLEEEGLDHVLAERERQGQSGAPGREAYSRCAKALVRVGQAPGTDRALGLDLELVVVGGDPFGPAGQPLGIELRHLGRPLAGALVEALALGSASSAGEHAHAHEHGLPHGHEPDEAATLRARTDERGRVALTPDAGGRWLVAAVHMVPFGAAEGDGAAPPADWESLWASLTFELAPAAEAAPAPPNQSNP